MGDELVGVTLHVGIYLLRSFIAAILAVTDDPRWTFIGRETSLEEAPSLLRSLIERNPSINMTLSYPSDRGWLASWRGSDDRVRVKAVCSNCPHESQLAIIAVSDELLHLAADAAVACVPQRVLLSDLYQLDAEPKYALRNVRFHSAYLVDVIRSCAQGIDAFTAGVRLGRMLTLAEDRRRATAGLSGCGAIEAETAIIGVLASVHPAPLTSDEIADYLGWGWQRVVDTLSGIRGIVKSSSEGRPIAYSL